MRTLVRQFGRFLVVGSLMTVLSYAVLMGAHRMGLHYLVGVTAGWLIPTLISYVAHSRFTFRRAAAGPSATVRLLRHLSAGIVQWAAVCAGYLVAISGFNLGLTSAFLVNALFGALVSFVALRWGVFAGQQAVSHGDGRVTDTQ